MLSHTEFCDLIGFTTVLVRAAYLNPKETKHFYGISQPDALTQGSLGKFKVHHVNPFFWTRFTC